MPTDTSVIETRVLKKYGQKSAEYVEGPHKVGHYEITRVWTYDRAGDFHAHYHVALRSDFWIFENFPPFASWLAGELDKDSDVDRRLRIVQTAVASIVVLAAMGLLVWMMSRAADPSRFIPTLLTGVVGVSAGFLFGTGLKTKKPPSK